MNIYFAALVRGGREDSLLYADIIKLLGSYGMVATEHLGKKSLSEEGEQEMLDQEIYERDMSWLSQADVVVAEVSTPSLGVGYEIARAETMEKPVLCIYRLGAGKRVSAMLAGNANIEVQAYENLEDLTEVLENFLREG
ncbi:MAG: nucleoside 2-deoxyribosyltransferase [Candidatus Moranbacteria bacterium]|nr:nucleoside 2-deoxyribosyltransferase [Candidatus Moranbacteria bacterium]